MLAPVQGVFPYNISQKVIPSDHTSHLPLKQFFERICGDMQRGLPRNVCLTFSSTSSTIRANPKSVILATPFFRRMFAGLMSRWMTLFCCRILKPLQMFLKNDRASASLRYPSFLLLRYFLRSVEQCSKKKYRLFCVRSGLQNFTMFDPSNLLRRSSSLFRIFMSTFKLLRSICFTANSWALSSFRQPRKTFPKVPYPRIWGVMMQLSTCFAYIRKTNIKQSLTYTQIKERDSIRKEFEMVAEVADASQLLKILQI